MSLKPTTPKYISEYARACLVSLAGRNLGKYISIGGAFGLAYYYEYRSTHDIDTWWEDIAGNEDRRAVIDGCIEALHPYGNVHTRKWGDVVSIELIPNGETHVKFSFQIAHRSVRLVEPVWAPWPDKVKLDTFTDLLASKMVALVERGAPRDFRDIFTLCQEGFASPERCWELWRQRQLLSEGDADVDRAILAIKTHLARIESQRPLSHIENPDQRTSTIIVRTWFRKDFLDAALD